MKKFIKIIFTLVIIISLVKMCEVEALTTVQTPSIISIKQYSGDRVIKNCTNTTSCDYSSDSTNLQYVQTTYNYNFTKGKRYKIKANGYYRWGSPISMNPEFQHLLEERVAFTAPYFKLETTQCYIKVTDYVVEDSSNYNEVSQMSYNVEYTCEFSPEANFTSIAFMTLTDATLLTSNLTIMSSGMTVEEVVNNQDIINNANNNQGQTNQRLDEVNDNLNSIDNTLKDDSTDNDKVEDTFSIIEDRMAKNGTITNLVILPVTLFSKIANSVNGTCQDFSLGELFGNEISFPCIDVSNYLGDTVWSTIDILFTGFFIFVISKKMMKVFDTFTSLQEGDILD